MKIPINTFHFKSQFNHKLYKLNDVRTLQNMAIKEANTLVCCCPIWGLFVLVLVSVGQLVMDKLIVGTTGRTALGLSLMKPEPHNSSVVFLTETSHQPLGSNAWHNVRVVFGTGIVLWFQDAVRVLSLFEGLEGTALQSSGLFFICWYASHRGH